MKKLQKVDHVPTYLDKNEYFNLTYISCQKECGSKCNSMDVLPRSKLTKTALKLMLNFMRKS